MRKINNKNTARIPVQQRSKVRFNKIMATAEEMMLEIGVDEVSPHKIAKRANIPPASIYQYFPTMGILFSTMAEIHFIKAFDLFDGALEQADINSWQDLALIFVDGVYDFYAKDKISEGLFLGIYLAPGVRELSTSRLTRFGVWYTEKFTYFYAKSALVLLPEKIAICIEVMKGVFLRCIGIHGKLQPSYKKEASTLVMAYLGEFFNTIDNQTNKN